MISSKWVVRVFIEGQHPRRQFFATLAGYHLCKTIQRDETFFITNLWHCHRDVTAQYVIDLANKVYDQYHEQWGDGADFDNILKEHIAEYADELEI